MSGTGPVMTGDAVPASTHAGLLAHASHDDAWIGGRYRSLFTVGRGGMGTVEAALDLGEGGVERVVALKRMLPRGAGDPRHREMFLREAQLAAWLAHPNVVRAFAFGEIAGEMFLAMEYVEGEPLSRVLSVVRERGEWFAPALIAHVLAQVCDGLHAAHELCDPGGHPLRVVHRDVSPHNVMIAYAGQAKILDFGVAKFDVGAGGHQTRTGEVKGKMAYMSPEQALGEPLDRRTDLFSVGAILFECVAGHRMWGTGTDLDVMRKLALEDPPRLDATGLDVPGPLVDLHARLVARDRERRPATARDVAEQLRSIARDAETNADTGAVGDLMTRLFGVAAEETRARLAEARTREAPAGSESRGRTFI
ncbi:MAG: serine/threonine-protein kinase, partial [Polyangiaceae bacterium]